MAFSYSFHISSKGHSVSTKGKVNQVGRHNLREYKTDEYNKDKIDVLVGEGSMLECIEKVYHREFDEALEKYNQGKREDRKIANYLDHVDKSRNDVAVEIIIQIGDRDFWEDVSEGDKRKMSGVFQDQLDELERILPNFKVASAVAHYDESSPHLHVVGVPVATGYQKGMEKQCAKTKVFTKESLEMIQDVMHQNAQRNIDKHPEIFGKMELEEKTVGRNKDIPKQSLNEYYELQEALVMTEGALIDQDIALKQTITEKERLEEDIDALESKREMLEHGNSTLIKDAERLIEDVERLVTKKSTLENEINVLEANKDVLEANEQVLVKRFLALPKVKSLFDRFKELWQEEVERRKEQREERQTIHQENKKSVLGTLADYEKQIAAMRQQGNSGLFGERHNSSNKTKTDRGYDDR